MADAPKRTVRRVVSDDPAAIPQEGESGTIYEWEVWENGHRIASFYDEEHAHALASHPDLLKASSGMLAVLRRHFRVAGMPEHRARPFNAAFAELEGAINRFEKRGGR